MIDDYHRDGVAKINGMFDLDEAMKLCVECDYSRGEKCARYRTSIDQDIADGHWRGGNWQLCRLVNRDGNCPSWTQKYSWWERWTGITKVPNHLKTTIQRVG